MADGRTNLVLHPDWRTAKTFSDLIELNRKFLLGQLPNSPFYWGAINDETGPLVPALLKLHDFGLFTDGSQPYEHTISKESDDKSPEGLFRKWQQRSYVQFWIPGTDAQYLEFFSKLKERDDVVLGADVYQPFHTIKGSVVEHNVTRYRKASTKAELGDVRWRQFTWIRPGYDVSNQISQGIPIFHEIKAVHFHVAGKDWGVDLDLLEIVREAAAECGLAYLDKEKAGVDLNSQEEAGVLDGAKVRGGA